VQHAQQKPFAKVMKKIFESPDELEALIAQYFAATEEPTMTGLHVYLGVSKQTFSNYGKYDETKDIIEAARLRVESVVEHRLLYGSAVTGAIFWLKNHAGYKDVQEQHHGLTAEGEKFVMNLNA
jgi:hypothetical protein